MPYTNNQLNIRDDEVQRLNLRLRQQQSDVKDVRTELELSAEKVSNCEKIIKQLEQDYQVALQEVCL